MSSTPLRILVVDDDPAVRRALEISLAAHGYAVAEAGTGEQAIDRADQVRPDLVLLDMDMPGMGGMRACGRLRSILPNSGLVMITVCDGEEDKIRALDAGADDYITKPFSVRELIARLRALVRRLTAEAVEPFAFRAGELELDTRHRRLRRSGVEIRLSPIEFNLLAYLMGHANTPIEHSRLLRAIWGPEYGSELEYLRTYIRRLRKKIEADPLHPEYLITVPWHGYSFYTPARRSGFAAAAEPASVRNL
jgi:two-component system KDP operon response regulator KdpE